MAGQQAIRETESVERRDRALNLRLAGASYAQIGRELDIPRATAYKTVQTALQEIRDNYRETATEVMGVELARLDALTVMLWKKAAGGEPAATDRILRIMERRAKLLGLDAPTKIAPTDPTGESEYAGLSDDALRELAAKVAAQQATDGDA